MILCMELLLSLKFRYNKFNFESILFIKSNYFGDSQPKEIIKIKKKNFQ